ncbi:hypothetical protein MACK_002551 [Theileria orientalis]|uniref:Uncharacterized protein n=1 Tax=Theileria orientalis TaxID=68886 RepID=A0A976MDM2_THEOR|nr:hypothetical protein MACK_002551 [Theileria orientalis]
MFKTMTINKEDDFDDEDNEFLVDTDDSLDNQKPGQSQRTKPKIVGNVTYKRSLLKFGKVRKFKYAFKNIGSLYLTAWVREDAEKDIELYIASSNFKRDFSKRKAKENQPFS